MSSGEYFDRCKLIMVLIPWHQVTANNLDKYGIFASAECVIRINQSQHLRLLVLLQLLKMSMNRNGIKIVKTVYINKGLLIGT